MNIAAHMGLRVKHNVGCADRAIYRAVNLNFVGGLTNCPTCGEDAKFVDGNYEAYEDRIKILLDPNLFLEIKQAISNLIRRVQANETSLEEAKDEAEKLSPSAGRLFDVSNWSTEAQVALFGACLMAAATLVAPRLSTPASNTEIHIHNTIKVSQKLNIKDELQNTTAIPPVPPIPSRNPKRKK